MVRTNKGAWSTNLARSLLEYQELKTSAEGAGQVGSHHLHLHLHQHQEHLLVGRGGSRQGGGRPSSCGGSPRCGGEVVPCVGGRRRAPEGEETLGEAARGKKEVLQRKHLKKLILKK